MSNSSQSKQASLVIVGFGIKFLSHLTVEARTYIQKSDKVLYLVCDPVAKDWIQKNSLDSESLDSIYQSHPLRQDCYQAIADYIIKTVRQGLHVCVVIYGHPTIFTDPAITAVSQAKQEGFDARIFPGISAEDCLCADLLVNPGSCGCQSYEATDFLIYQRPFHITSHLILWQIGLVGILGHLKSYDNQIGINLLTRYLTTQYPLNHEITLYEAAQYPQFEPRIEKIMLQDLIKAKISPITTLYLPPARKEEYNKEVLAALKIESPSAF